MNNELVVHPTKNEASEDRHLSERSIAATAPAKMYSTLRFGVYLLGYGLLWLHTFQFCVLSQKKLSPESKVTQERSLLPMLDRELVTYLKDAELSDLVSSVYSGTSLLSDAVLILASIARSIPALNSVIVYLTASVVADSLTNFVAYREVKQYCLIHEMKKRKMSGSPRIPTNLPDIRLPNISAAIAPPALQAGPREANGSGRAVRSSREVHNTTNILTSLRIEELGEKGCNYLIIDYNLPFPLAFVLWKTVCVFFKIFAIGLILCLAQRFRSEDLLLTAAEVLKHQRTGAETSRPPLTL